MKNVAFLCPTERKIVLVDDDLYCVYKVDDTGIVSEMIINNKGFLNNVSSCYLESYHHLFSYPLVFGAMDFFVTIDMREGEFTVTDGASKHFRGKLEKDVIDAIPDQELRTMMICIWDLFIKPMKKHYLELRTPPM